MDKEKINVVVIKSVFNSEIVDNLYRGVEKSFNDKKLSHVIEVIEVPGAFEIPVCVKKLIESNNVDVMIALGVIIKGETAHAELVGSSVTQSLQEIATNFNTPIIHEVLLTENREQAIERCDGDKNRGKEAAKAAATMSELFSSLDAANKRNPNLS